MATGADILSTTLPTVVGMGVVSQTTQTMFGKGKGRGSSRVSKHTKGRRIKIYRGKRGGEYIIRKGRRIYI